MSWMVLLVLLCPWASAQSLDLATLELAKEQSLSPEYREMRDLKVAESITRLKGLMSKGVAEETRAELQLRLADLYFQQGLVSGDPSPLGQAATLYADIRNRYPRYARVDQATFYKGRAELLRGDRQAAADAFRDVIKLWPDSQYTLDAYLWLGEVAVVESPYAAVKAWMRVMAAPDHRYAEYATYRVAWAYHALDEHPKAVETLNQAARATDDQIREAALADLATGFGTGEALSLAPPALVTPPAPPPAPAPAVAAAPPEPCAAEREHHARNAGQAHGPQLTLQLVQCLVAQGDFEAAHEALNRMELRYGRGTDWYQGRSKAERKRVCETIRRAEALTGDR